MIPLTVGSLFSGIGGFELGLERTGGFKTVWQCEIDPFCQKVLAKHWPNVKRFTDIKKMGIEEEIPHVNVICGGFPCFTAGTLIETSEGYKPIESISVGDEVKTHENRFRKVYSTMKRESPVLKVDVKGSLPLEVTAEHPFLIRRRIDKQPHRGPTYHTFGEPEWVCAKDLDKSCYVGMPLDMPESHLRAGESEAFWYLIGRWLGDGWIVNHLRKSKIPQGHRGSRVNSRVWKAIICTSHEDADDLKARIEAAGYNATEAKEATTTKFHISSKALVTFLEPFGRGADGKKIPGYLFKVPLEVQRALFQGWIDSDGYENDEMICGTTISKELAVGMTRIAKNTFRVPVTVRLTKIPDKTTIEGRVVSQRPFYQVRVWKNSRSIQLWEDDYCWSKVSSVEDLNTIKTVYNISVEEDETYVAEECIVHNCQDISCAGKGAGIHAERSGLWWEMLRIIRLVGPRYVIVENVAALVNRGLDEVLGSLAESGYDAEWTCLRASDFGLHHNRERIFLVAYPSEGDQDARSMLEKGVISRAPTQYRRVCCYPDGPITRTGKIHDESPLVRSVHGLSKELHASRLAALGNTIVPQCAQFVGQCLLDSLGVEAAQ